MVILPDWWELKVIIEKCLHLLPAVRIDQRVPDSDAEQVQGILGLACFTFKLADEFKHSHLVSGKPLARHLKTQTCNPALTSVGTQVVLVCHAEHDGKELRGDRRVKTVVNLVGLVRAQTVGDDTWLHGY